MPRILILHASVGTGHKRAADAISQAFAVKQEPEVRVEDTLDHGNPLFQQAYRRSYLDLSERSPLLWRWFYETTDTTSPELIELTNSLRSVVERLGVTHLEELVQSYMPAAIICTHFLPIEMLLSLKNEGKLPPPVYCVVTDYFAHTFWVTPGVDGYFVGSELTRDLLAARGVSPSIIHITGIPIDLKAAEPKDKQEMCIKHNLPTDKPVITLFGGGINIERIRVMIEGILKLELAGTLLVVAGRNEALVEALDSIAAQPPMELRILSYIDYVDDLLAASDIVITKAGGLIVSETMARGTPMLLIDPIPGQEEWNADYVVSSHAGLQLRMVESVPGAIRELFTQPDMLKLLRAGAQRTGRPRAALTIAEHVLNDLRSGKHD